MMLSSAIVLALAVRSAAFSPPGAIATTRLHQPRLQKRSSSALAYASHEDDGETLLPPDLRREMEQATKRRVPRRAMPHVQIASHDEAAKRAGYIIRESQLSQPNAGVDSTPKNSHDRHTLRPAGAGVRPLRTIRRAIHRSSEKHSLEQQNQIGINAATPSSVQVVKKSKSRGSRLSLSTQPQPDEFLDRPEQLRPDAEQQVGARRVTFKASRESSMPLISKPSATLTEYMTQPVSQYSLLSFHDAEEPNAGDQRGSNESKQRRWIVRRLTTDEAKRYMSVESSKEDVVMDESNLFRLAVPLLPLIGWDLTPVIDLEVIPPEISDRENGLLSTSSSDENSSSNWAPLRVIRKRMRNNVDDVSGEHADHSPVVKIRSLRVSLLSAQEEVNAVMSKNQGRANNRRDRTMQKEALEMVGKVEEWLKPHISFEAELAWDDTLTHCEGADKEANTPSIVTVKSTAITSLTIPRITSDLLRKTIPSGFLVKRLGATLTSRALAICLPRFLRQLEKDYIRWSGEN